MVQQAEPPVVAFMLWLGRTAVILMGGCVIDSSKRRTPLCDGQGYCAIIAYAVGFGLKTSTRKNRVSFDALGYITKSLTRHHRLIGGFSSLIRVNFALKLNFFIDSSPGH
jgi:hypothetical protein